MVGVIDAHFSFVCCRCYSDNELIELTRAAFAHNITVVVCGKGDKCTELSIEDLYSIGQCAVVLE